MPLRATARVISVLSWVAAGRVRHTKSASCAMSLATFRISNFRTSTGSPPGPSMRLGWRLTTGPFCRPSKSYLICGGT